MKFQSLVLGSLVIVAGGLAACSPGNSVTAPTCGVPGCAPTPAPGTSTVPVTAPTPLPGATSLGTISGNATIAVPGAPAGSNATVTIVGAAGGALYALPFSTAVPAGLTLPTGATYFGTSTVQNAGTTPFTGSNPSFSANLGAGAAGQSCVLATQTNGSGAFLTTPGTVSGTGVFTVSGTGSGSIPPGTFYTYAVYCTPAVAPLAGSTTIPAPSATTVAFPAGGLTGSLTVPAVTGSGNVALTPISASPQPSQPPFPNALGTGVAYAAVQNLNAAGGSSLVYNGSGSISVTVPGASSANIYYLAVAGLPGTSGYVGNFGPGTIGTGGAITFSTGNANGFTIPAGSTLYYVLYSVPSALTSPSPIPAASSGVTAISGPSSNGSSASANAAFSVSGGTIAQGAGAATITAGAVATPSAATVASIGLPVYTGGTGNFGGTALFYGSFVLSGTGNVSANTGGQTSTVVATISGLSTYAAANPNAKFYLAPIDTSSGLGYLTAPAAAPGSSSQVTFPILGTYPGGAGAVNSVSFSIGSSQVLVPGVTYGYAVIAK